MTVHRCSGRIRSSGTAFFRAVSCSRNGTVKCGGVWYCRTHDPDEIERRKVMKMRRIEAALSERAQVWRRHDQERRAFDACKRACELIVGGAPHGGIYHARILAKDALSKFPKEK